MTAFAVPSYLAAAIACEASPARQAWLANLPTVVAELRQRWSLTLGAPFEPGGQTSWVAPATDGRGREVVLKVGWQHPEAADEAAGLRAWSGYGAVLVQETWSDEHTNALLLERCVPGTALGRDTPESEQDIIIAGLLRGLWRRPVDGHSFRPLWQMCAAWADEFERDRAPIPGRFDPGLARAGIELFRLLPTQAADSALLCTDLHAGNVIAARREPCWSSTPTPRHCPPCSAPTRRRRHIGHRTVGWLCVTLVRAGCHRFVRRAVPGAAGSSARSPARTRLS